MGTPIVGHSACAKNICAAAVRRPRNLADLRWPVDQLSHLSRTHLFSSLLTDSRDTTASWFELPCGRLDAASPYWIAQTQFKFQKMALLEFESLEANHV